MYLQKRIMIKIVKKQQELTRNENHKEMIGEIDVRVVGVRLGIGEVRGKRSKSNDGSEKYRRRGDKCIKRENEL